VNLKNVMSKKIVILLLGLVLAFNLSLMGQSEEAKELFNAGVDAETNDDQKVAAEKYNAAIAADKDYASPRLNLGVILYSQKKYKNAMEQFDKVVALEPDNLDGWKNLGLAATKTGNIAKGDNAFIKANELQPNDQEIIEAHAMLFFNNNAFDRAIGKLEELIKIQVKMKVKDKKIFYALGKSAQETGNMEKAITNYNSAVSISSKYYLAYFELGNIYRDQKSFSKAINNYKKAVAANSKHYQSWYNMGGACLEESTEESIVQAYDSYKKFLSLTSSKKGTQMTTMRKQVKDIVTQLVDYFDQAGIIYEE